MNNLKILKSNIVNPFHNLAIESSLLNKAGKNDKFLFIYINEPSIVLGRFQNPWLECDINEIIKDGVHLVRRQSGGGTVYHDLGNVNFSFIQGSRDHQKDENNSLLIEALGRLGLSVYASGRSDLIIEVDGPKKISGSAFKQKKDSSIHHGTMLINSNLNVLNSYLTSKHPDLEAKGIKSVRSTVINLSEIDKSINEDSFIQNLSETFNKKYDSKLEVIEVGEDEIDHEHLSQICSWEWKFGETPRFECNRIGKNIELNLAVHKGTISKIELFSETISPGILELVSKSLINKKMRKELLEENFSNFFYEFSEFKNELVLINNFLKEQKIFI